MKTVPTMSNVGRPTERNYEGFPLRVPLALSGREANTDLFVFLDMLAIGPGKTHNKFEMVHLGRTDK